MMKLKFGKEVYIHCVTGLKTIMIKLILKIFLAAIFTASVVFAGCNKVKSLLDINFDADFKVDMSVDAVDSGLGYGEFNIKETVDPLDDEEVQKYIDNIKGWEVTDLTIKFKQVDPDFDLSEGQAKMYNDNKTVEWNLTDQKVYSDLEISLGNENNQWAGVNELINQKKPFTINLTGKTTPGSKFKVQLIFNSKITANPL